MKNKIKSRKHKKFRTESTSKTRHNIPNKCILFSEYPMPPLIWHNKKNTELNPPLDIIPIQLNAKQIYVVQDGSLLCGTKQRASIPMATIIKKQGYTCLTYCGAFNGFGAVATAYGAKHTGLSCQVFLSSFATGMDKSSTIEDILKYRQIQTLFELGAIIHICKDHATARKAQYAITDVDKSCYVAPMGLNDEDGIMVGILSKQMKKANTNPIIKLNGKKKRIWLVAGSGGIISALNIAFPNNTYFIYLTGGGKYYQNVIEYTKFHDNVIIVNDFPLDPITLPYPPLYESVEGYDDRILPYVFQYGQSNDIIWNVASNY